MEIIIRTDYSVINPSSNDGVWCEIVAQIIGVPIQEKDEGFNLFYQRRDKFAESIGWISEIEYLRPSRITDSYIGGSHGWIDWDGFVGTSGHNIGKWPKDEEVLNDWKILLQNFPFLSLRAQLFDREQCEEGGTPIVEYIIGDGNVEMKSPGEKIAPCVTRSLDDDVSRHFTFGGERYCSVKTLKEAIALVRK